MKEMKSNSFIACADIHLRDSIPACRTDDYWKAQEKKFEFLINTANKKNCDIYCAGDFFHRAKSSSYLEAWVIDKLRGFKNKFKIIPGQHDLPNHNIDLIEHSSLWVLRQAGVIDLYSNPFEKPFLFEKENIMLIHKMIHKDKSIHSSMESTKALNLLKEYPDIKLIISGDNHTPFIVSPDKSGKRGLVNCGSMMRTSADQIDYIPKFYYIEINKEIIIDSIPYPIEKNVVDRSYIEIEKKRDSRMETFVNRVENTEYEIDLNFDRNLESYFTSKKTRKSVQEICWRARE